MKIKKITISGMHKISSKTYTFNNDVTYFVGENGAGKSTILEAIQLALLGYIPGYSKTNESVMKHAAGPTMSIILELDSGITITRTWMRSGTSVQSNVDTVGCSKEDIPGLLGEIELPVFDFNEFRSMTANKLKEWFINFLPSTAADFDIEHELSAVLGDRALMTEESMDTLFDETIHWIQSSGLDGLNLVKALNTKFKEDQSFLKGQIANLTGTIQSLIRYDDAEDWDEEQIRAENAELNKLMNDLSTYQVITANNLKIKEGYDNLRAALPADYSDNDERVRKLKQDIADITKQNLVLNADYADLQAQISELERAKAMLPKAGSKCPYTNQNCDTAAQLVASTQAKLKEIDSQIAFKREEQKDCSPAIITENNKKVLMLNAELGNILSQYDRLVSIQIQLDNMTEMPCPTTLTADEIAAKVSANNDKLVQIAANKKYDELADKVTADKFKLENQLEVYKLWIKRTDANGLQTELMNKPFTDLAAEMSTYLTKMFNKDVTAQFNLSSKANSFSFGLVREDKYIEFDYLSSGERCLFTLALIMCILNKSTAQLRLIIIDDILDHLDDDNSQYLFSALKSTSDIQFILAGVKACTDAEICKPV